MEKGSGKKNKKRLLATFLFITSLALLLSTVGVTLAKYVADTRNEGMAVAKPFYFSSDKLAADKPYFQLEEPLGDEAVSCNFTLNNFVDSLRCTDVPISYYYQVVSAGGTTLAQESGTLAQGSPQEKEVTLSLRKSDFGQDGRVTVTAYATAPYEKTISAEFGFAADVPVLSYSVVEKDYAVVLSIAGGSGEQITVTWPATLTPDLSNPVFLGATPISTTFTAQSGVRYALTFLKSDMSVSYSQSNFSVSVS